MHGQVALNQARYGFGRADGGVILGGALQLHTGEQGGGEVERRAVLAEVALERRIAPQRPALLDGVPRPALEALARDGQDDGVDQGVGIAGGLRRAAGFGSPADWKPDAASRACMEAEKPRNSSTPISRSSISSAVSGVAVEARRAAKTSR